LVQVRTRLLSVQVGQVKPVALLTASTVLILFLFLSHQLVVLVVVLTVGLARLVVRAVAVHTKTVTPLFLEGLEHPHKGTMVVKVLLVEQQVRVLVVVAVLVLLVLMV
jgi:hypothetical protein